MLTSDVVGHTRAPKSPGSRSFSPATLVFQGLLTIPFVVALMANFIMTSVPDYRPAGTTIRIDSAFPSTTHKDRDNIITGSYDDMQVRFRCSPAADVHVGSRAELLTDAAGNRFSIAACAAEETWAANKARWSAWAFVSFLLVLALNRIEPVKPPR